MTEEFDREAPPGKDTGKTAPGDASADAAEAGGAGGSDAAAAERRIAELEAELKAASDEAAKNYDLYLRERAEADNFRKRLQREKAEAIRFGNEALVRDVLPLLDNLELAAAHAELGGNGKSVVEGIRMILRMFRDVLERNGVKPIEAAAGAAFDPTVHEACGTEATSAHSPNTVIRQEVRGYELHGRLLRPARVVVAAEPKDQKTAGTEDDGES